MDLTIHPHLLKFQHTAARRRLHLDLHLIEPDKHVSTHSRPKAAAKACHHLAVKQRFQHTAARRRLRRHIFKHTIETMVSTHSRPKAAAFSSDFGRINRRSFNTQPPEGGCFLYKKMIKISKLFTVFRYPLKYKEYQEV